jgi:NitT/TauT family transport system substrate-binding protein
MIRSPWRLRLAPLGLGATALLAACGSPTATSTGAAAKTPSGSTAASHPRTVTLLLGSAPTGFEAPFVYGVQSGIYRRYGLDVKWRWGTGTALTTEDVAAGKVMFGDGTSTAVLKVDSSGGDVVAVYGFMQQTANAVIVPASSSIHSFRDLPGHTLGGTAGDSSSLLFPAVLKKAGISPNAIHIDYMSPQAQLPALYTHKVEGLIGFGPQVKAEMAAKGVPVRVLSYSRYGVNTITLVVVTNRQLIQAHPNLVRAFVAATQAAVLAAKQHPHAAVNAVYANASGTAVSRPVLLSQWESTIQLMQTPNDQGHPLGWMSAKDWQETARVSQQYLGLKITVPVAKAYTNRFIPAG